MEWEQAMLWLSAWVYKSQSEGPECWWGYVLRSVERMYLSVYKSLLAE